MLPAASQLQQMTDLLQNHQEQLFQGEHQDGLNDPS
jgi:hypothetical protein